VMNEYEPKNNQNIQLVPQTDCQIEAEAGAEQQQQQDAEEQLQQEEGDEQLQRQEEQKHDPVTDV
jgi:hypothetical protein